MVKISTLSGVAAAALLIGVVGATAQGARDSGAGNTQPSGGGASSAQGSGGSLGASGAGGAGTSSGGAAGSSAQSGQQRSGAGAGGAAQTSGSSNTQPPGGGASSAQGSGGSLGESGNRAGAAESGGNRSGAASGSSAQGSSNTRTGASESSSSGGAVTLSSEEQTKLKTSIHNVNVKQVTNINVDVRTGTVLPETVISELEPIPPQIVEIVPRFRGYRVVRVKNEILIVEPSSRRVVYIIQS